MDNKTFNSAYYMETKSPSYARTLLDCKRVAASNANVLLIGESGTGKDVAAQYIHALSRRSDKPFIAVNCNAYTESLLEPELFGVEPGIFSDTIRRRVGKFELADHGTLFLDAIGDVSMTTQVKLLRAIETQDHVITTEGIPILYNLKRMTPVTTYSAHQLVTWKEFKRRSEKEYLEWALRQNDWNISAASRELSLSTRQIFN